MNCLHWNKVGPVVIHVDDLVLSDNSVDNHSVNIPKIRFHNRPTLTSLPSRE